MFNTFFISRWFPITLFIIGLFPVILNAYGLIPRIFHETFLNLLATFGTFIVVWVSVKLSDRIHEINEVPFGMDAKVYLILITVFVPVITGFLGLFTYIVTILGVGPNIRGFFAVLLHIIVPVVTLISLGIMWRLFLKEKDTRFTRVVIYVPFIGFLEWIALAFPSSLP